MSRPAAFLDRDGTIITDTGFVRDPEAVVLLAGAAAAIGQLKAAGFVVVVVTNQSGIARGILSWDQYHAVAARLERLLAETGAVVDATYVCPHHPSVTGPCDCRKPGLKHYLEAAARFDLDLAASCWIGDRLSDLEPSLAFGGRGLLVETGDGNAHGVAARELGFDLVPDLATAARKAIGLT
jgi:D-glycero-D-manno-heptose 1,7-bisphosphate phosphatase